MAITSIGMVHFESVRKTMLALHTGTAFGLGHRYYYFTDAVSIITLLVCGSGLLMYVYPPLNRWLKTQKDRIFKQKIDRAGPGSKINGRKRPS